MEEHADDNQYAANEHVLGGIVLASKQHEDRRQGQAELERVEQPNAAQRRERPTICRASAEADDQQLDNGKRQVNDDRHRKQEAQVVQCLGFELVMSERADDDRDGQGRIRRRPR